MNRLRLLTLEGTDNTDDGTGLIMADILPLLNKLPKPFMVRIPIFEGVDPKAYLRRFEAIRQAGIDIMLQPIDSQQMASYNVHTFHVRFSQVLDVLGSYASITEYANEINGTRHDSWLPSSAYIMATSAELLCRDRGLKCAATYYLDPGDEDWMYEWIEGNKLSPDYALISWYPYTDPEATQPLFSQVFSKLAHSFPTSWLGFGEYGTEDGDGVEGDIAQAKDLIEFVETLPLYNLKFIGGGGYWDTYHNAKTLIPYFKTLWGEE